MSRKLSATQHEILDKMKPGEWYCAHDLQCSLSSLKSMEIKGVLKSRGRGMLGSIYTPRTTIEFSLL